MEGKVENGDDTVSYIFVITRKRVRSKTVVKRDLSIKSCSLYTVTKCSAINLWIRNGKYTYHLKLCE
jgi:hypothetical protein